MRNDQTIYEEHAQDWWDPRSRWFRSLHSVNVFRLGLLERWFGGALPGSVVVDLGCGGGLLAEPLAKRGARVVGCDLSLASLVAARRHALEEAARRTEAPAPSYVRADLSKPPLRDASADLVLLADVLEHLPDPRAAIRAAAALLRPGGALYVNTISRSLRSRILAVGIAEGLGLLPRGTHDPDLFIPPGDLDEWTRAGGLDLVERVGESIRLVKTLATWTVHLRASRSDRMSYSALYRRRAA